MSAWSADSGLHARAIDGAIGIARGFGLTVREAVPLRSTNNLVCWLSPAPVVAKIGTGGNARLRIELEIAQALIAHGGPAVSPALEIPAVVHAWEGLDVTFWQYHAQTTDANVPPARLGAAMGRLHSTLAQVSTAVRTRLPSYLREVEVAGAVLADAARAPALAQTDRQLLAVAFDRLLTTLKCATQPGSHVVIHGSPHSYNVLLADGEPLFIDFETACTGPAEWDVAHLGSEAGAYYPGSLDSRLLWACRGMASVWTAALCWCDVERGDLREHAEMHLDHVRTHVAPHL